MPDPASSSIVFAPTPSQLFNQTITPDNAVAVRTAPEKSRFIIAMPAVPELAWLKPSSVPQNATVVTDPQQALLAKDASEVVSDTGELRRDWQQGIYMVNTPRTQAAMGWIGARKITLADVELDITTPNATVAVQSLDDNPISKAHSLMISLGARSVPEADQRAYRSEPVVGNLAIRAPAGMKFYRLSHDNELEIGVPGLIPRRPVPDRAQARARHLLAADEIEPGRSFPFEAVAPAQYTRREPAAVDDPPPPARAAAAP